MKIIKEKNADDLFISILKEIKQNGIIRNVRGFKTVEIEDLWLQLENPNKAIIHNPLRNINKNYLRNELKWYLSGSLNGQEIGKHSKFWLNLLNPDGTINSNYGYFVFKQQNNGISQFDWCVNSLNKDNNSRQAIINYNQPRHKYEDNKDFPCTLHQHFRINNNKLESRVFMRSNDLIYGFTYDLPWFCLVQKKMAKKLNKEVGSYYHYTQSMHIYEKHFKILENI